MVWVVITSCSPEDFLYIAPLRVTTQFLTSFVLHEIIEAPPILTRSGCAVNSTKGFITVIVNWVLGPHTPLANAQHNWKVVVSVSFEVVAVPEGPTVLFANPPAHRQDVAFGEFHIRVTAVPESTTGVCGADTPRLGVIGTGQLESG
jgi:hypothetical protein